MGYREPCNSAADCPTNGQCETNACNYGQLPNDLPKACVFTNQCTDATNECGPVI